MTERPIGVNPGVGKRRRALNPEGTYSPFHELPTKIGQRVHLIYKNHPKCPYPDDEGNKCTAYLMLLSIRVDTSPYPHTDVMMYCPLHKYTITFGIPDNKESSSGLLIWDTNYAGAAKKMEDLGERECPFEGHGKMLPTKVFGDWIPVPEKVEFQWKCITCFLTHHETHDRDFPHKGKPALTEEEQKALLDRLRAMGYLD